MATGQPAAINFLLVHQWKIGGVQGGILVGPRDRWMYFLVLYSCHLVLTCGSHLRTILSCNLKKDGC